MNELDELRGLYLAQTEKVARLASGLGLHGDRPAAELGEAARQIARDRAMLLRSAEILCAAAGASEAGQIVYVELKHFQSLARAVATAAKQS